MKAKQKSELKRRRRLLMNKVAFKGGLLIDGTGQHR